MATAKELILAAMVREEITWPLVHARLIRDERVPTYIADDLIKQASGGDTFSIVVAAAIITLIADKKAQVRS